VVRDHAGGEVDVEIAGQRTDGVGRRDTGLLEDILARAVALDGGNPDRVRV